VVCSIPGWGLRPGLCWPAVVGVGGFSGGELVGVAYTAYTCRKKVKTCEGEQWVCPDLYLGYY